MVSPGFLFFSVEQRDSPAWPEVRQSGSEVESVDGKLPVILLEYLRYIDPIPLGSLQQICQCYRFRNDVLSEKFMNASNKTDRDCHSLLSGCCDDIQYLTDFPVIERRVPPQLPAY